MEMNTGQNSDTGSRSSIFEEALVNSYPQERIPGFNIFQQEVKEISGLIKVYNERLREGIEVLVIQIILPTLLMNSF